MHPREARERLGTGRLTRACLPNSAVAVGAEFDDDARVQRWIDDPKRRSFLLYPGGPVLGSPQVGPPGDSSEGTLPLRVFVLDGTWPTAKGMLKRSAQLRALPRLSIEPGEPSRFRIKHQPAHLCLSTIESVHRFLVEATRAGVEATEPSHDVLLEVLDELCSRQIECARDPNRGGYRRKPYSAETERAPVKRWLTRRFFLPGP